MLDRDLSTVAHPESADLVDYAEGCATASVSVEIDQHLEDCKPCRELVAVLSDYRTDDEIEATPGDPYAVDHEEVAAALQSVLASWPDTETDTDHTATAVPPATVDVPPTRPSPMPMPSPHRTRRSTRRRFVAALPWAALILIAVGWGLSERRARLTTGLPAAIANVPILALQEFGNPLRSHQPGQASIRRGAVLTLADDDPLPAGLYSVSIADAEGATALEIYDLEPWPAGHLSFFLPPYSLNPGEYEVVLRRPDHTPWPRRFVLHVGP